MNTYRNIELIASPREAHYVGDGFRVHNFIPSMYRLDRERMDPFIMLDYNSPYYFSPTEQPRGVSVHPHRGFETVTIAYKGAVAHHDSAGNSGVIYPGDVQWMTAASGILHKEYHEEEFSRKGGEFQMVQLWVNLPAKDKMSAPKYQALENQSINRYKLPENTGYVEVIAGEYKGIKGSASTFTPVHLHNVKLKSGAGVDYTLPADYNTALLVISGSVKVNKQETALENQLVLLDNDGEDFYFEALEDALVLVLSGQPLNEPIAAHGPFVMNTSEEIAQAFQDYNIGKFGYLE